MRARGRRKFLRGRAKGDRGAGQVEFILSIITVLFVMFWIWEMIMVVYTMTVLADAAKEGVRYAIVHGDGSPSGVASPGPIGPTCPCPAIENRVREYARLTLHDISGMTVTVTYPDGNIDAPARVNVTVVYDFVPYLALPVTPRLKAVSEGRIVN